MKISHKMAWLKIIAMATCAIIASLGSIPYGYQASYFLRSYNVYLSIILGVFFATTAVLSNAALGTSSLLRIKKLHAQQKTIKPLILMWISLLGAVPGGCIFFFGYKEFMPAGINFLIALIVIFITSAINYVAFIGLIIEIIKNNSFKLSNLEKTIRVIGFLVGLVISFMMYLATVDGLTHLFTALKIPKNISFNAACILAVLAWLPPAALYSNSTQLFFVEIYRLFLKIKQIKNKIDVYAVIIFIISISGSVTFAQMMIEFFAPGREIPTIFKTQIFQEITYFILVPLSMITSSSVNFLSLMHLRKK